MDRRLFADHIRRHRQFLIAVTGISAAVWFGASFDPEGAHWAMAISLLLTFVAGPLGTFQALALTEVRLLPISRRGIWRTGWWLSVVVAIGVTTTGKVMGLAAASLLSSRSEVSLDMIWLSTTYDLAQAGALIIFVRAMWAAAARVGAAPRALRLWRAASLLLTLATVLIWPAVFFIWPLPIRWQQLGVTTSGLIVLGLVLTVLNYFVTPARVGMPGKHAAQAAWRSSKRFLPYFERITGLKRLVFETWRAALFLQVGVPLLVMGVMAGVNIVMHSEAAGWMLDANDFGLLPFAGPGTPRAQAGFFMLYFLGSAGLVWPFAMIGHQDVLQFMLRHLRTLPFGTRALNAIMLILPLVSWINLWLVLLVFHFAVIGGPVASLRLGEWLALVGIDAVVRAMHLRWRSYRWPVVLGASALVVSLVATKFAFGALPAIAAVAGAAALFAAWALNQDTLTRSRLAYSRVPVSPQIAALQPEP